VFSGNLALINATLVVTGSTPTVVAGTLQVSNSSLIVNNATSGVFQVVQAQSITGTFSNVSALSADPACTVISSFYFIPILFYPEKRQLQIPRTRRQQFRSQLRLFAWRAA
jgi:hypothetical protein